MNDIAKMTLFDEYGSEDTLEISGLTISLSNTMLPRPPRAKIREGEHSVTGTMEVYFTGDQIYRWHRAAAAAQQNRMLRIARPHMGRRQFLRFRGMLLAQRRADWSRVKP